MGMVFNNLKNKEVLSLHIPFKVTFNEKGV